MGLKELSECDGGDDKPAHIAYKGKVYDVSKSKLWPGGVHMERHHAGCDLSPAMDAAPHGPEVLERIPEVGLLTSRRPPARPMPKGLSRILKRFPILKRHPHPSVVHFPIVFFFSAPLFSSLFLITAIKAFEFTALHCLGGGILFMPPAIVTGFFTWWLNYFAKPMRPVTIKIILSFVLMAASVGAFVWRLMVPDVLTSFQTASAVYFLLVLSLIPLVTIIGWLGGLMTFPVERD
ncbi:MAG: cytochrome b5 [Proteobacteria bacterium]|nr:cytochrome b5 [Pseudomonadota bacterium]